MCFLSDPYSAWLVQAVSVERQRRGGRAEPHRRAVAWKEMSLFFKTGPLYLWLPGLGLRVEL